MSRWIVFDTPTADAVQDAARTVDVQENGSVADALNSAVQHQQPVVLVLAAGGEQVTVARVTPPETNRS